MGTQPAEEVWITKKQTAEILGVGAREVERMAKNGRIHKLYQPPNRKEDRRYGQVLYLQTDVRVIEQERLYGVRSSAPLPPQAALALAPISQAQARVADAQVDAWHGLAAHLAKLSAAFPTPKPQPRAWLTLEEAVDYCGLPLAELERLLREGLIYSFGRGPKTWRIQRASLDAYGQASHQ
jgi:hypothetical protein